MSVSLKIVEFTTCKLIFKHGITKEEVAQILSKHTSDFTIATFCDDATVGCNRMAFAVVDLPLKAMQSLNQGGEVKDIDLMTTFSKKPSAAGCAGGSCGCGS
jgi:hypothetical protein